MKIFLYQQYKGKETNYKDFLVPTVLRNRNKLWNINGRGGGVSPRSWTTTNSRGGVGAGR
jgi:hypothetical protein